MIWYLNLDDIIFLRRVQGFHFKKINGVINTNTQVMPLYVPFDASSFSSKLRLKSFIYHTLCRHIHLDISELDFYTSSQILIDMNLLKIKRGREATEKVKLYLSNITLDFDASYEEIFCLYKMQMYHNISSRCLLKILQRKLEDILGFNLSLEVKAAQKIYRSLLRQSHPDLASSINLNVSIKDLSEAWSRWKLLKNNTYLKL